MDCTLEVTFKCNWRCSYCSAFTHDRDEIKFEHVLSQIEKIENGSSVAITGGEPGLLEHDKMEIILLKLKQKHCIININTNGTFFKRHTSLFHLVDSYLYHCTENIDINDELYENEDLNIKYEITVDDENISRLNDFINKYNKEFLILGADETTFKDKINTSLSKKNRIKIVKDFKDNLSPESIRPLLMGCYNNMTMSKVERL